MEEKKIEISQKERKSRSLQQQKGGQKHEKNSKRVEAITLLRTRLSQLPEDSMVRSRHGIREVKLHKRTINLCMLKNQNKEFCYFSDSRFISIDIETRKVVVDQVLPPLVARSKWSKMFFCRKEEKLILVLGSLNKWNNQTLSFIVYNTRLNKASFRSILPPKNWKSTLKAQGEKTSKNQEIEEEEGEEAPNAARNASETHRRLNSTSKLDLFNNSGYTKNNLFLVQRGRIWLYNTKTDTLRPKADFSKLLTAPTSTLIMRPNLGPKTQKKTKSRPVGYLFIYSHLIWPTYKKKFFRIFVYDLKNLKILRRYSVDFEVEMTYNWNIEILYEDKEFIVFNLGKNPLFLHKFSNKFFFYSDEDTKNQANFVGVIRNFGTEGGINERIFESNFVQISVFCGQFSVVLSLREHGKFNDFVRNYDVRAYFEHHKRRNMLYLSIRGANSPEKIINLLDLEGSKIDDFGLNRSSLSTFNTISAKQLIFRKFEPETKTMLTTEFSFPFDKSYRMIKQTSLNTSTATTSREQWSHPDPLLQFFKPTRHICLLSQKMDVICQIKHSSSAVNLLAPHMSFLVYHLRTRARSQLIQERADVYLVPLFIYLDSAPNIIWQEIKQDNKVVLYHKLLRKGAGRIRKLVEWEIRNNFSQDFSERMSFCYNMLEVFYFRYGGAGVGPGGVGEPAAGSGGGNGVEHAGLRRVFVYDMILKKSRVLFKNFGIDGGYFKQGHQQTVFVDGESRVQVIDLHNEKISNFRKNLKKPFSVLFAGFEATEEVFVLWAFFEGENELVKVTLEPESEEIEAVQKSKFLVKISLEMTLLLDNVTFTGFDSYFEVISSNCYVDILKNQLIETNESGVVELLRGESWDNQDSWERNFEQLLALDEKFDKLLISELKIYEILDMFGDLRLLDLFMTRVKYRVFVDESFQKMILGGLGHMTRLRYKKLIGYH